MKKEELLQQVYQTAFDYEAQYGGCAQCTLASIRTCLGGVSADTFTAATALAGGVAASGNACGACTGAILSIGSFLGRDFENFGTPEGLKAKNDATMIGQELVQKFMEAYGSIQCADIQKKLYGKSYKMYVPEEKEAFLAAGGHGPEGCTKVVANAAKWVTEILLAHDLVKVED